jgi:putative aldouronate transport system substrate-binding protein
MINFGAQGADYKLDDNGNPVATGQAANNVGVPWRFVTAPQQALYMVNDKETVQKTFDTYQAMVPVAVKNPCGQLHSPTDSRKGSDHRPGCHRHGDLDHQRPIADQRLEASGGQVAHQRWRRDPHGVRAGPGAEPVTGSDPC